MDPSTCNWTIHVVAFLPDGRMEQMKHVVDKEIHERTVFKYVCVDLNVLIDKHKVIVTKFINNSNKSSDYAIRSVLLSVVCVVIFAT
jgi:hypothetical protein